MCFLNQCDNIRVAKTTRCFIQCDSMSSCFRDEAILFSIGMVNFNEQRDVYKRQAEYYA